jgi:hypothetical protein
MARKRAEHFLIRRELSGHRHGQQRAAVKSAVEDQDTGSAGVSARYLDGVLDRFGSGRDQQRFLVADDRHQRVEPFREFDERLIGRHREAGVRVALELLIDAPHHPRVAMARVEDGDASAKIDVALVLDVPEFGVGCTAHENGSSHAESAGDRS